MVRSPNSFRFGIPYCKCDSGKIDPPSKDGDKQEENNKKPPVAFDPNGDVKPTSDQTIVEITSWLKAHSIDTNGKTTKDDLLSLVPID